MNLKRSLAAALVCMVGATSAHSATVVATITGGNLGNDPFPQNLVYSGGGYDIDSPALYKCDDINSDADNPTCVDDYTQAGASGTFTVDFDDGYGGSWSWQGDGLTPHYMAVKAGNGYTIWDLMGQTSGLWDTTGLGNAGVSHISFYNTGDITDIPLPASAALLLVGLGGLVIMRRRKS